MKRQFLILIAIAVVATALTTDTFGQTGRTVKANIKFSFQIGERYFPAGEYLIEQVNRQNDNILQIRNISDTNKKQIINTNLSNAGKRQSPKLVFQKSGENYSLLRVFLDSERWGYAVRPSRSQRETEKNLALVSLETIEVSLTN